MRPFKLFSLIILFFALSFAAHGRAQSSDTSVDSLLGGRSFRFVAQTAHTTLEGYNSVPLNTYYAIEFTGDRVMFSLPYFGQRYNGGKPTTDSPLDFTSDIVSLTQSGALTDKKGVVYKFQARNSDQAVTFNVTLRVFDNARATMQITATSYTKVDFNGYIAPLEAKVTN